MKATIYDSEGDVIGTVEAAPFQYDWRGNDPRAKQALEAADQMQDVETAAIDAGEGNTTSPRERLVDATEEDKFSRAVADIRDLGYWVDGTGMPGLEADSWDPELHPRGPDGKFINLGGVADRAQDWLRERYPDTETSIFEDEDKIRLEKVVVPEEMRGEGVGSEYMEDLTEYADGKGKQIRLDPSTDFGASSRDRLVEFYKRFGFVENEGEWKDYAISESMYRPPGGA